MKSSENMVPKSIHLPKIHFTHVAAQKKVTETFGVKSCVKFYQWTRHITWQVSQNENDPTRRTRSDQTDRLGQGLAHAPRFYPCLVLYETEQINEADDDDYDDDDDNWCGTCNSSWRVRVHVADVLSGLVSQRMNVEAKPVKVRPLDYVTQPQLVLDAVSSARQRRSTVAYWPTWRVTKAFSTLTIDRS